MSEPQPPNADEVDTEAPTASLPANASAEDRKAAAALSSLDAPADDAEAAATKSAADQKALGEAMSRLENLDKSKGGAAVKTKSSEEKEKRKVEEERRRKVKVDAADVNLIVEHLELTKAKATELLKAHDGKVDRALDAYLTSSA